MSNLKNKTTALPDATRANSDMWDFTVEDIIAEMGRRGGVVSKQRAKELLEHGGDKYLTDETPKITGVTPDGGALYEGGGYNRRTKEISVSTRDPWGWRRSQEDIMNTLRHEQQHKYSDRIATSPEGNRSIFTKAPTYNTLAHKATTGLVDEALSELARKLKEKGYHRYSVGPEFLANMAEGDTLGWVVPQSRNLPFGGLEVAGRRFPNSYRGQDTLTVEDIHNLGRLARLQSAPQDIRWAIAMDYIQEAYSRSGDSLIR